MSQHDMVIDNASGASVRSDLNNALAAIATLNSGTGAPSTPYADQVYVDTTAGQIKQRNSANSASIIIGRRGEAYWGLAPHGQCELVKSGANLLLRPKNGNKIVINGVLEAIGSGGVALAATSLSANTNYFIYLYNNSGTLTLEASTTGHSTDATTGVEIKTGDATRTLVGYARVVTGPAWADSATQRFVRTWFNDPGVRGIAANGSGTWNNTGSFAEATAAGRVEFLAWSGEQCLSTAMLMAYPSNADNCFVQVWFDGSAGATFANAVTASAGCDANAEAKRVAAESEGYHSISLGVLCGIGSTWTAVASYGGQTLATSGSGY